MQRKEELLSQLDVALKRKVQEKYMKQTRTQEMDPLQQEFYGGDTERNKHASKMDQKYTNTNTNLGKSPHVVKQKQPITHARSQNNIHVKNTHSPNQVKSPKLQTEKEINHESTSSIHMGSLIEDEVSRLKGKNQLLEKELRQLKMNITQLEGESKLLKREENEYFKLKQDNLALTKEIQFLRAKNSSKKEGDLNVAALQQEIKRIMLQLNISFIHKPNTTDRFISESLKGINQGITKLIEEKNKLSTKLNNFDIENILNKQNNSAFRKEIDILRSENQQLQDLIEDNCNKIEELERDLETEGNEKRKLEFHYKEVCKQLDGMKRQFKLTVEASKHSKPKRQYSAARNKESPLLTEQSIARTYSQQQIQTQHEQQQAIFQEVQSKDKQETIEQRNVLMQRIKQLTQTITDLQTNNLKQDIQKSKLEEKVYKYQQYIKELQYKSQEIQKDLNNFMPQLKQIEQENRQLKQDSTYKDQQIINKLTTVNKLRNTVDQLQEKLNINEMEFRKQVFQHELARKEVERMKSNLAFLTEKENNLENELRNKQIELEQYVSMNKTKLANRQNELSTKLRESQFILNDKNNELDEIKREWSIKENNYLQQIAKLKEKLNFGNSSRQQLGKFSAQFDTLKHSIDQNIANYHQTKQKTKKLLIEYGVKIQQAHDSLQKLDQTTDNIWQQYTRLQKSYDALREEKEKVDLSYQNQVLKNDELVRQMFSYKCDIQRLSFDSKNNGQLKDYFQQTTNELKSKLEQLLMQNTKLEKEKSDLAEKNGSLQRIRQELEVKNGQIAHNWELSHQECEDLKRELYRLSNDYHLLSQDYIAFKNGAQTHERQRLEQISLQAYDIERLVRESGEMKARLEQLTSLKQSKNFRQSQADQRIVLLTEQNRSLGKRYEILEEELRMKQANKEQDQYLSELKNKQYCILLKKLLTDLMDSEQLESYSNFQQLLQIASERAVKHKKKMRDHESEMRKTMKNEYEIEYTKDYPVKRYYIGTEISSSQELMAARHFGQDEILEMQSKIIDRPITKNDDESPKSFKFSFSPYEEERKEKRTERLISCFNNGSVEGQSKVLDNRQTFKN